MTDEPAAMNKELQKLYMQAQILEQQCQQLQKQMQAIDQQVEELSSVKDGLERLKDVKPGTEIFVPFAGGVFVKAELKDNADLLLNVGAGVAVTKPVPETVEMIAGQMAEMEKLKAQMAEQLDRLMVKGREIEQQMEKLV